VRAPCQDLTRQCPRASSRRLLVHCTGSIRHPGFAASSIARLERSGCWIFPCDSGPSTAKAHDIVKRFSSNTCVVEESYLELKRETLENIFYTWLAVMEQVMLHEGSNSYKMPRVKKQQIRNCIGGLPQSYICSIEAVTIGQLVLLNARRCVSYLRKIIEFCFLPIMLTSRVLANNMCLCMPGILVQTGQ